MKNIKYGLIILLILPLLNQCSGSGTRQVTYPGMVTPEVQTQFNEVERHYKRKNYSYAYDGYQHFIETYPYNKLTDEAYYKQGKIFFLQARLNEATHKFKELAQKTPSPKYKSKAWLMTAYARYKANDHDEAHNHFRRVSPDQLTNKMRVQYYSLIIKNSKKTTDHQDYGDYATLRLFDTYEDFAGSSLKRISGSDVISYDKIQTLLAAWLVSPFMTSQITDWLKKYPKTAPSRAYVDFKLGKTYFEENKFGKAKKYLIHFLSNFPKNQYSAQAKKMLAAMGTTDVSSKLKDVSFTIGVLVPLAGRYETFGYSVIDGVKCAAGINSICHPESGIRLVVKDSGYAPETIRDAVDELAKAGVAAIIGPLSSQLAIEAGIAASEKRIPIFPITQKSGLMSQGNYIFQVGMQPKQQIQEIIKAARSKGFRSFGIFHPNTNYGQTMAELFMEEARLANCRITALAEYNKWSKDPYAEARKLKKSVGRVGTPDRGVGFDAIFIPDSYQNVNSIVGALEFNGMSGVALIGTNAWNDPKLSENIATKFPGSFFIDLYDPNSKNSKVEDFNRMFLASFGRAPRVLEAYGYDIMMMIREIVSDRGENKVQDAILEGRGYDGVTGIRGFLAGEGTIIESNVMEIK